MQRIEFFDEVEKIVLNEPLGEFLGSNGEHIVSYADVVKLSGHSCPTVSGAYLMSLYGLKALYEGDTPNRGDIKVEFRNAKDDGVTGVIANVISFITGAKQSDGFKGLGGKFARNNLLFFGVSMTGEVRFTRIDNAKSIEMSYDISKLPLPFLDNALMQKSMTSQATSQESELFKNQWQSRVKEILITHKDRCIVFN
jgi:hypothetical protein